jgi:ABC-2 type transport system permease protein
MKRILMVAGRDLKESMSTKGFWIGILMLPITFLVIGTVSGWVARQQPDVTFIVLDRAGGYVDVIDKGLERGYRRAEMAQLQTYLDRNLTQAGAQAVTVAAIDRTAPQNATTSQITDAEVEEYIAAGGSVAVLAAAKPYLRTDAPPFEPQRPIFYRLDLPEDVAGATTLDDFIARARPYLTGEKPIAGRGDNRPLSAAVFIPEGFGKIAGSGELDRDARTVPIWASEASRGPLGQRLGGILSDALQTRAYDAAGVDPSRVAAIQDIRASVTQYRIRNQAQAGEGGGNQRVGMADMVRQFAPVALGVLLFQALIFTVSLLLTNTIEEKSNRVIEVLLSSMTPHELMIGKLLGCAAIGGMIVLVWGLVAAGFLALASGPVKEVAGYAFTVLSSSYLLPAFLIYFLLAYLMFSAIFLTIGSLCNTVREAQNLMAPIMLLMVVPIMSIFLVPRDPNGTIAVVLSWIPLFSPIVMLARISSNPPVWQIVGTGILMILTAALLLWGTGAIFKRAILRSGAPLKFRELFSILSSDL